MTTRRWAAAWAVAALVVLAAAYAPAAAQTRSKHRLPSIYTLREHVEAGGLMAYGPGFPDLFRRAATFVDKIMKGARPGDLPVEQASKFELALNLRTAKTLGLALSPALVARADQVVQ